MKQTGKVALVTGANKGIGLEIARSLGRAEHTVLMGARDEALGRKAAEQLKSEGLDAQWVRLDVTRDADVEALAAHIRDRYGRLDVLVNNAGVNLKSDAPGGAAPLEAVRSVFETNFFGVVALTQALLPLVKESPAGRIVNVSSGLGSLTQQSDPNWSFYGMNSLGYNASKTALNGFTVSLAKELGGTNVKVNSADPGWVRTDMGTDAAPLSAEDGADTPVWLATLPPNGPTGGFFSLRQRIAW